MIFVSGEEESENEQVEDGTDEEYETDEDGTDTDEEKLKEAVKQCRIKREIKKLEESVKQKEKRIQVLAISNWN